MKAFSRSLLWMGRAQEIIKKGLARVPFVYHSAAESDANRFRLRSEKRRDDLFIRAVELPRDERATFLTEACAEDAALREDLTSLLEAHDSAGDYFDRFSTDVVAPTLSAMGQPFGDRSRHDVGDILRSRLAGAYRIERELLGGGMSRVFVAEDLRLKRDIVIKVLPLDMAQAANAERFHREIELAARLQHPHIVPVLATDSVDGMLYYTMPFVAGESLSDRIRREGPLPLEEAVNIWRDILDALAYAHSKGVIHLDVKPGNILLSGRHALVTDFGIARAIETAVGGSFSEKPGRTLGTPAYMAPEEAAASGGTDPRTDIYSAGLVMYEMLEGRGPFVADSANDYLTAHRTARPHAITQQDVPRDLLTLVMLCIAKDPEDRPESAEAILAQLDSSATVSIHETGRAERILRLWREAPTAIATLLIVVAALTVMTLRPETSSGPGVPQEEALPGGRVGGMNVRPNTTDIAAYEWYLRGMDVALLRTNDGRQQGIAYFKRAIAIDSTYVAAYAGLVRMYVQLSHAAVGPAKREWLSMAREAALRAVTLDHTDADAHAALGWVHLISGDYTRAETEFIRATALDTGVPRGHEGLARVHMIMGRPAEQLAEARLGLKVDPFSHSAIRELALALATNGRCEESFDQLRALKSLSPPAGVAGVLIGQCFASRGMWPEAIAEFRWSTAHSSTAGLAFLGYALARADQKDEASGILSDLLDGREYSHGAWGIAVVHAGMRDFDLAFEWFDKAVDDGTMNFYIMHPVFGDLHRDPRFSRLKVRMGTEKPESVDS